MNYVYIVFTKSSGLKKKNLKNEDIFISTCVLRKFASPRSKIELLTWMRLSCPVCNEYLGAERNFPNVTELATGMRYDRKLCHAVQPVTLFTHAKETATG